MAAPSKRGTGKTTTAQAQSRLRELVDGTWQERSTRNDEVATELRAVIGLGKDEFTKVAMLPQGAFAAFLRAKDKEREDLLKTLFDTRLFGTVETLLADELTAARTAAEDAERSRATAITQLVEDGIASCTTTVPRPRRTHHRGRRDRGPAGTARRTPGGAQHGAGRRTGRGGHGSRRRPAGSHRARRPGRTPPRAGRTPATAQHPRRAGRAHRRPEGAARRGLGGQLAGGNRNGTHPRRPARDAAESTLDAARRGTADGLAADYLSARPPTKNQMPPGRTIRRVEARLAAPLHPGPRRRSGAGAALPDEHELAQQTADLQAATSDHGQRTERHTASEAEQETVAASLPGLRERADALAATATSLASLTAARDTAAERVAAVEAHTTAEAAATAAHAAWAAAKDRQLADRANLLELGRTRLGQAAAALARELVDGEPCLVCGSADHPAPATVEDGELVEEADEEAARDIAAASEAAETEGRHPVARRPGRRSPRRRPGGRAHPGEAAAALADAEQALADATAGAREAERAATALADATAAHERLRTANTEEAAALTVLAERIGQWRTSTAALRKRLAALRGDDDSLQGRHERMIEARQRLETPAQAARSLQEARTAAADAARTWRRNVPPRLRRRRPLGRRGHGRRGTHRRHDGGPGLRSRVGPHRDAGGNPGVSPPTPKPSAASAPRTGTTGRRHRGGHRAAGARDAVLQREAVLRAYSVGWSGQRGTAPAR
ncbi:hypothetical protein [Arthrobacter sp.]|uniref:hypothetical protein n=1 Tax=Arthrobacter sp. TaxID=1667 RepID=UPI003A8EC07E